MRVYYIYKITNTVNGKIYIGYSYDPHKRWSEHKSNAKYQKYQEALYHAMRKYGIENFVMEVLCGCKDSSYTLKVLEPQFIKEYRSHFTEHGYNLTPGGEGVIGHIPWNKGKHGIPCTEETRAKLKNRIPWNKGKKIQSPSLETRQKLSEATKRARQNKYWSSGPFCSKVALPVQPKN